MAEVAKAENAEKPESRWYKHYVLFVLVLVYIFNFIDRNILSILAEDIKADLGIDDAQMGFLYGTVFAVFYAVFGIPLARFADVWTRRSLVSVGLGFWSLMTAASGLARSFSMLAVCRIGVGIGEASASPAAYSMLSDYYPPRVRATVIAIYAAGVYIGAGIGIFLGGTYWKPGQPRTRTDAAVWSQGVAGRRSWPWACRASSWRSGCARCANRRAASARAWSHPSIPTRSGCSAASSWRFCRRSISTDCEHTRRYCAQPDRSLAVFVVVAWMLIWLTGSVAQWITTGFGVLDHVDMGPVAEDSRPCHVPDDVRLQGVRLHHAGIPIHGVHRLRLRASGFRRCC